MSGPIVWSPKPLTSDESREVVVGDGQRGQIWRDGYIMDHRDDGAFRFMVHSDYDGVLITIALAADYGTAIHPYTIVVDRNGYSEIWHHLTMLKRTMGAHFPRGKPAWIWVRFLHGHVSVGFGNEVGQYTIMEAKTPHPFGGGYQKFAIGKTGNNGAFELLDVQPLERRRYGNINLRGTGDALERVVVWPRADGP